MGKDTPLAREEKVRRSVLLARAGPGCVGLKTTRRNSRQAAHCHAEGNARPETANTPRPSAGRRSTANRVREATNRTFSRKNDSAGKPANRIEGEDCSLRRRAKRLVVVWDDSHPHIWKEVEKIRFGTMFVCKGCRQYRWLPDVMQETQKLQKLIHNCGYQQGYNEYLNTRPELKILIWAVQNGEKEHGTER